MLDDRATAPMSAEPRGFGHGEHLLVWSWRRIAMGWGACPALAAAFAEACGEDGAEVFLTFCTFLKALGYAGRRPLAIGAPGALAVTQDERQVLTLIAAGQAPAPALFEAHLRWLARPAHRHVLEIAARALATALKVNALWLALREPDMPQICERPYALA